jgi:hypothetical protein
MLSYVLDPGFHGVGSQVFICPGVPGSGVVGAIIGQVFGTLFVALGQLVDHGPELEVEFMGGEEMFFEPPRTLGRRR